MGKLSKIRKQVLKNANDYKKSPYLGYRVYRTKRGIEIYGTWACTGYKKFVQSVLKGIKECFYSLIG